MKIQGANGILDVPKGAYEAIYKPMGYDVLEEPKKEPSNIASVEKHIKPVNKKAVK